MLQKTVFLILLLSSAFATGEILSKPFLPEGNPWIRNGNWILECPQWHHITGFNERFVEVESDILNIIDMIDEVKHYRLYVFSHCLERASRNTIQGNPLISERTTQPEQLRMAQGVSNPVNFKCKKGWVLVGFRNRQGLTGHSIDLICSRWRPRSQQIQLQYVSIAKQGGTWGVPSLQCPDGQAIDAMAQEWINNQWALTVNCSNFIN